MSDDLDDELIAMQLVSDETGQPLKFDSLGEASAALRDYLAEDGTIEVHADGCDGEPDCGCGFETFKASELFPRSKA